jgi:serine protease Do
LLEVFALNDDQKDFFGLSEIDKIQEEIERDLNNEPQPILDTPIVVEEPTAIEPTDFYRETIKAAPKKTWTKAAIIVFFICTFGMSALGFGMGAGWAFFQNEGDGVNAENSSREATFTGTSYVFESTEPSVATLSDMVELIAPSVVGITTYRKDATFPANETSYGSGIIFADSTDRIFIATNLYVVRGGYRWDVTIGENEPVAAYPVGLNHNYDLAVAYVYKEDLVAAGINSIVHATFGNSDEMRIGDVVLAIGNAMGEGTAVTRGIISAAERAVSLPDRSTPLTMLQTDAAINYGNSGGPLVNTRGEIVGININQATWLIIGSSQVEGMGYSISSNIAAPILDEIIANYRMPAIGIMGVSLNEDMQNRAEKWGIPEFGVLVLSVQEGRPADLAGILPDDVITSFDGQPIFDMEQLQNAIRAKEIGDTVEIRILRNGTRPLIVYAELAVMMRDTF